MEKKSFLFIFKTAPHESSNAKEGMDFAFSCAAFEQQVDAIFTDNGLFQLVKKQDTKASGIKNHSLAIEAFELYGISNCFYDMTALEEKGLNSSQLIEAAKAAPSDFWQKIASYDYIYRY